MHYVRVGLIYKPHGLFAGNIKRCATFLRTFFNRCESEIDGVPSQAYFLQKRRSGGPLCYPMPSWIFVDTLIPCPSVVDKEGADTVGVHSSQTITFRMKGITGTVNYAVFIYVKLQKLQFFKLFFLFFLIPSMYMY